MNENEEPKNAKKPDALRRKGFYLALYSCVGVMLVLAVVIGYSNFRKSPGEGEVALGTPGPGLDVLTQAGDIGSELSGTEEGLEVSQSGDMFLDLQGQDAETAGEDNPIILEPGEAGLVEADLAEGEGEIPPPGEIIGIHQIGGETGDESLDNSEARKPAEGQGASPTPGTEAPKQSAFRSFDESGDVMAWPVLGDVVMDYSADHLIYDKTLEQYRTNSNICIAAPEGTDVNSAADGIVTEIYTTRENGRTVVVDHGNGWTTTYSQLQDNILVRVGDVVESGQKIGGVGVPSMFSSLLGSHLAFTVCKDNAPVDPNKMLYQR